MSQRPFRRRAYRTEDWQHYRVSAHFRLGEFIRDQTEAPPRATVDMVAHFSERVLEPLRARFGRCVILSGHRSPVRNREVGGAAHSWHVWEWHPGEMGVDVAFARSTPPIWAEVAAQGHAGGIGTYRSHLHVDSGPRRYWSSVAP